MVKIKVFQKFSFEFNASLTQYIAFDNTVKQVLKDDFDGISVSFWYRGNADGNNGNFVSLTYTAGVYRIRQNNAGILYSYLTPKNGWSFVVARSNIGVNDGNWHHVVAVWDGNSRQYKFYVDGVLDKTTNVSFIMIDLGINRGIYVGAGYSSGREPLSGKLGEIRIYDRPLTDTEIQYLYKGGHIEDGLVFWLYPDEDSVVLDTDGQTVLQVTEKINGYVGTAYNGVKLVDGKDVDVAKVTGKRFLIVRKI